MIKGIWEWIVKMRIHFIVWIVFISYDLGLVSLMNKLTPNPIIDSLHFLINICFFYFHANFILPWGLKNKWSINFLLVPLILLQLVGYVLAHFSLDKILIALEIINLKREYVLNFNVITRNLYRGIYFLGFSTGYYFLKTYLAERRKTEELEKGRLQKIIQQQQIEQELVWAKNAYLKAQINPHFLFNTLDFVYHKVNVQSEIAGEAIVKLAEMMRFAINADEMEHNIVLKEELEQVENLLYLNQLRKSEPLNLQFTYAGEIKQLRLIPLVILTLVENIFKHGDLSDPNHIATVDLLINDQMLTIQTNNLINHQESTISNHAGLKNINQRLIYAYGEEVVFNHSIENDCFKVIIHVPLALLT